MIQIDGTGPASKFTFTILVIASHLNPSLIILEDYWKLLEKSPKTDTGLDTANLQIEASHVRWWQFMSYAGVLLYCNRHSLNKHNHCGLMLCMPCGFPSSPKVQLRLYTGVCQAEPLPCITQNIFCATGVGYSMLLQNHPLIAARLSTIQT